MVTILGGPHAATVRVLVDGKELRGVQSFRFEGNLDEPLRCHITMLCDADITALAQVNLKEEDPISLTGD